ncbi:MAG: hypothetical protein H0V35_15865 [Nitrospira sp.]|nr:hypothetical protein [Nitrospira sp.]
MVILVLGGDSVKAIAQRARPRRHGVSNVGAGANKGQTRSIEAVVVILDRVKHTLARKIRAEATRRGLPVFFQKRRRQVRIADHRPRDLMHWLNSK